MGFKKTGCSEIQCMTQNTLKFQIFALLNKFLVHSKVLQWEHRIYFNKGTRKRNGCLNCQISIKYFSESSMNKKNYI